MGLCSLNSMTFNNCSTLFLELVRVAICQSSVMSSTPSASDWEQLYHMAKKHALLGVCFFGVQRLPHGQRENLPMKIKMQWIAVASEIERRNEVLDERCVQLQRGLEKDGFKCAILKGQGNAALYNSSIELSKLRQSGDIDVWVSGGMKKTLAYCREKFGQVEYDYINAHVPVFKDVDVELHWRAQAMTNLFMNRKLQRWLDSDEVNAMMIGKKLTLQNGGEITVPSSEFNIFYQMLHCYHHMFESGLGLRQLMDYYYLLKSSTDITDKKELAKKFKQFGMDRFASAVMWIMQEFFCLEDRYLLCEPDEKEGRFILREVMIGGNFGHHDQRIIMKGSSKLQFLFSSIQHNWHLATRYPSEFFWAPVWLGYHFIWKRLTN